MIERIGGMVRLPLVRSAFVVVAVMAAAIAVAQHASDTRHALSGLPLGTVGLATLLGLAFMLLSMLVWRTLLHDMGSQISLCHASHMFFLSQLGKYVPGGVWNIVAAAEIGADYRIPRRQSVSAMVVAVLVSIVTGLALAVVSMPFAPEGATLNSGRAVWALPIFVTVLAPPVLNRLLNAALRMIRRPSLKQPVTAHGIKAAVLWSVLAWLFAGAHIWILGSAVGLEASFNTLALVTGGYALAWSTGFLIFISPAGAGVRELVLAALLASELEPGGVLVVVLISRAILTWWDLLLGLGAATMARRSRTRNS
jgi:uncharacterized membrane protein YbhN (UPF0104 family)